jgi:site-specific recombinase XerD
MRKPHDLRHSVAMDIPEQHHDLEAMRAMLGHTRIDQADVGADPSGVTMLTPQL